MWEIALGLGVVIGLILFAWWASGEEDKRLAQENTDEFKAMMKKQPEDDLYDNRGVWEPVVDLDPTVQDHVYAPSVMTYEKVGEPVPVQAIILTTTSDSVTGADVPLKKPRKPRKSSKKSKKSSS